MKFQIVDAFSDEIFGGNPAGVVLLDDGQEFPSDAIMLKTAAELRYSETAFIKKIDQGKFNIRYFTPAAEVDLCGHATIGSFGAMMEWGIVENGGNYILESLAGRLKVEIADGFIFMEMGEPVNMGSIEDEKKKTELAAVMGIKAEDIIIPLGLVSTGLPDIMMGVSSKQVLNDIKPDFPALSKLSEEYQVTGVHAFALTEEGGSATANCRNFAPLYDIDEEAATGTSNGALTFYLYEKGIIKPEERNMFVQGEAMNRPSKIMSRLTMEDGKPKIYVGGVYKKLADGEIYI